MIANGKKKIVVTGGAGFIGSNFVELLLKEGHDLVVLDKLTYAGHKENLEGLQGSGKFELVVGDICDGPFVAGLLKRFQPDGVIHFAAESHVDRSISGPADFIQTNIIGTFNLLEQSLGYYRTLTDAQKASFRFLHVSTDEVYGELGPTGKFSETTPYAPNSPYSSSKASSDLLVRAWNHTYGLPTIITNTSNNYGPRQFPEKLIPHMILCALSGKPLPVYGKGENIRDWVHVQDHARGVWMAWNRGKIGSTYCLGGNSERKNIDVVKAIAKTLDKLRPRVDGSSYESLISFVTDRPGHDFRYAIDDSLAQREIGFKREYASFEPGLEQTVQWYLDHFDWCQKVLEKTKGKVAFDWATLKVKA